MLPLAKVQGLISKHSQLEKDLVERVGIPRILMPALNSAKWLLRLLGEVVAHGRPRSSSCHRNAMRTLAILEWPI